MERSPRRITFHITRYAFHLPGSHTFSISSAPSSDAFALPFPGFFEKSKVMKEDEDQLLLVVHYASFAEGLYE